MKNLRNRKWTLATRPVGMVGEHNFAFEEEEVRDIEHGEFLIKNLFLSFDPAQRGWMEDRKSYVPPVGIGEVMSCLLYTSPSPRDGLLSRMPSSA